MGAEPALPVLSPGPCGSSASVPGVGRPAARASCRRTGFFPTWRSSLLSRPLYRWQQRGPRACVAVTQQAGAGTGAQPPSHPRMGRGRSRAWEKEGEPQGGVLMGCVQGVCVGSEGGDRDEVLLDTDFIWENRTRASPSEPDNLTCDPKSESAAGEPSLEPGSV